MHLPVNHEVLYRAFGLYWNSPFLSLPGLATTSVSRSEIEPMMLVKLAEQPTGEWPTLPPSPNDTPFLKMTEGDLRLTVPDIVQFRVHAGGSIAWQRAHSGVSDMDLQTFLLGSAVGALLIQRGMVVLHGNALVRDGKAVVCLGQ